MSEIEKIAEHLMDQIGWGASESDVIQILQDWQAARAQGGEALAWACFGKSSLTQHFTVGSDGPEAERKMEALGFYSYETVPLYTHPAPSAPQITPAMIEAGAKRLVRWDENSTWPDSWSAMDVAAAMQDAERVLRSALSVMGGNDEH